MSFLSPFWSLCSRARLPRQRRQHGLDGVTGQELLVYDSSTDGMPADGLETEAAALRALTRRPLPGIRTPRLIEAGRLDEAEFVLARTKQSVKVTMPDIVDPLSWTETPSMPARPSASARVFA